MPISESYNVYCLTVEEVDRGQPDGVLKLVYLAVMKSPIEAIGAVRLDRGKSCDVRIVHDPDARARAERLEMEDGQIKSDGGALAYLEYLKTFAAAHRGRSSDQ